MVKPLSEVFNQRLSCLCRATRTVQDDIKVTLMYVGYSFHEALNIWKSDLQLTGWDGARLKPGSGI